MEIKMKKRLFTRSDRTINENIEYELIKNCVHELLANTAIQEDIENFLNSHEEFDGTYEYQEFIKVKSDEKNGFRILDTYYEYFNMKEYSSCDIMNIVENYNYEDCNLIVMHDTHSLMVLLYSLLSDLFVKDYMDGIISTAEYASNVMSEIVIAVLSDYIFIEDIGRESFVEMISTFMYRSYNALKGDER